MHNQDAAFEQAKSYLMKADAGGRSMYDHLHALVLEVMEENPLDVAHHPDRLAELSAVTKSHLFTLTDKKTAKHIDAVHNTKLDQAKRDGALFEKKAPEVKTVVEKPTPFTTVTTTTVVKPKTVPLKSIYAENQLWRYCGVGLTNEEAFMLDQSIAKLVMERSLEDVRFFGKIFGLSGDYYVIISKRVTAADEIVFEEVNEMPKPPRKKVEVDVQAEPAFKGANRNTFWVASSCSSDWVALRDLTPQMVNVSRCVSRYFTGDLNAKINTYPKFEGTEADLLRVQLGRIYSATFVAPTGALEEVKPEDDDDNGDDDEKKGPKVAKYYPLTKVSAEYAPDEAGITALMDAEQWVHSEGYFYKDGRQTKVPPKPETDDDQPADEPEDEEDVEEEKEEEEKELFGSIKKDSLFAVVNVPKEPEAEGDEDPVEPEPVEDGEEAPEDKDDPDEIFDEDVPDDDPLKKKYNAWTLATTNNFYKKHAVAVLKSLRWPGAVAYASNGGKKFGAVYFGMGVKKTVYAFTPLPAPPICKECGDILEWKEPTAANEKLVMRGEEPKDALDSEDEKDEDQDDDA